jgi:hypothetical protein
MTKRHLVTTVLVLGGLLASAMPSMAEHSLWINIAANLWWIWAD